MKAEILQQYEPAMLKIMKIVLERNTEISACCCQEALARMRTCLLTRYGAPGVGYRIHLVSNYPMKIQESTWWYDKYTYYILHTYRTTYRMSDHIVSFWTTFRRDKKHYLTSNIKQVSGTIFENVGVILKAKTFCSQNQNDTKILMMKCLLNLRKHPT